jgi:small GTP-binding protein
MEEEGELTEVKIVIIGNSGVGKTSMINRYLKKTFDENSSTTIGAMYLNKIVEQGDTNYKLQIWDTAG